MLKRTPFYEAHVKSGAKLIDFGGFEMPVQYEGIKAEHNAVREAVGLFDVSHMGEVMVTGADALAFIQKITINDASKLTPGKAQYSAMCYENGGIVDDLLVYMLSEHEYMLVINASNIEKDLEWMKAHVEGAMKLENISDTTCLLAVQGPKAPELVQRLTSVDVSSIGYYKFAVGDFAGMNNVIISETGYTGEKGFELYFSGKGIDANAVWDVLMEKGADLGIKPAGLGARDTLRLEMGYALYGNDISKDTLPLEAGLGWLTKLDKSFFIGQEAVTSAKEAGLKKKLIGFILDEEKAMPRAHYPITDINGSPIGEVTSGGLSITNGKGIGMGYASTEYLQNHSDVYISIRNKLVKATISKPPFIKK
ncbi:glycine cleavage system aminomethyltransferase GcvT [bacterium]|nr:MAG: glycine cleavage system aminomethyltransferase GcvT [bacterium]